MLNILLFVAPGIVLLTIGISLICKGLKVKKRFEVTNGTVVNISKRYSAGSDHEYISQTVEYEVNGVKYKTKSVLPKSKASVGDVVTVRYDRDNTKKVRDKSLYLIMGSIITLIGTLLTVAMAVLKIIRVV